MCKLLLRSQNRALHYSASRGKNVTATEPPRNLIAPCAQNSVKDLVNKNIFLDLSHGVNAKCRQILRSSPIYMDILGRHAQLLNAH